MQIRLLYFFRPHLGPGLLIYVRVRVVVNEYTVFQYMFPTTFYTKLPCLANKYSYIEVKTGQDYLWVWVPVTAETVAIVLNACCCIVIILTESPRHIP
jgi:hypothetical protein